MASVIERLKQCLKNDYGISKREFEVLILRISGHSIAECADKLFVTKYTVSNVVILIAKKYRVVIKPPQRDGELPLGDMNCNYKYKKGVS